MQKINLLTLLSVLALTGCASAFNTADKQDFSCPGMPNGVVCKSPTQLYNMTNGALPKNSQLAIDKNSTEVATKQGVGALQPVSGAPTPIREPARIMRIWISPWVESSTGDLNWPSYIYTEIEPRKWSFGSLEFNRMHSGIPTMIKQSAAVIPASKPEKQKPEPSVNSPQSNVSEDQKFNE